MPTPSSVPAGAGVPRPRSPERRGSGRGAGELPDRGARALPDGGAERRRDGARSQRRRRRRHRRDAARAAAAGDGDRHGVGGQARRAAHASASTTPIDYRHATSRDEVRTDHARPRRGRDPRSDRRPQLHRELPHARAARPARDLRPVVGRARRAAQLVARPARLVGDAALRPALADQPQPRRLRPAPRPPVGRAAAAAAARSTC